eukprot:XP_011677102.1 PREDICTED: probable E3 ubiquitin-protein ligase HUL5 [Strongylocentrotus purpuratus]
MALNLDAAHLQFEIDDDKEKVVESAISAVKDKDETSLMLPFKVHFKDNVSLGVNAGGPMKEFFSRLFEELFNVEKHSIFKKLNDSPSCTTLWFNKDSKDLDKLRSVGKLFALMFYNKVIVTMPFPFLFYKKLLGNSDEFDVLVSVVQDEDISDCETNTSTSTSSSAKKKKKHRSKDKEEVRQ